MEPVHAINPEPIDDFKHEPLDPGKRQIRLIKVLTDLSKEGLLQCRLENVPLAPPREFYEDEGAQLGLAGSAPPIGEDEDDAHTISYTCLSYTWGDCDRNHDIHLNGELFTVRQNLWDFLAMARVNITDQYFWIDALCIDQKNTKERNHQVQQMGNIYARAKAVIVWLGCDVGLELTLYAVNQTTQERAMKITDKGGLKHYTRGRVLQNGHISAYYGVEPLINHKQNNEDIGQSAKGLYSGEHSSSASNFFLDGTGKVEKVLENITTHPYWSRAWVTQEVLALCKEGANLKVDYSVSDEQLMRQVLSLRESSMCFCSAGVVSNALSSWEFEAKEEEGEDKALEQHPFAQVHMYAYALTSAVCPFCSNWVPFSWTRKKGLVFCLGLGCPDTQGHIFWEQEHDSRRYHCDSKW